MTVAELLAVFAAWLATVFTGTGWAVWPAPPDQTAVPAVWPEYASSYTAPAAGSSVAVTVVAAIAAQIHTAEYDAIADAHDRLDVLTAADLPGCQISSWAASLGTVDIGAVTHTALLYTVTIDRPLPC